ncbi:MAG: helix-turn-helix transcriptional regulator [Dermabacter sp.]|nr:helix-turn-helix transcriptional regulator [Dermabacter sp.]
MSIQYRHLSPERPAAPASSTATGANLLGDFLRAHRARISPEDANIASYGMRRVPGLRREELAQLAGVSTNYYIRLEQGEATHPSASVIAALARALGLDADATAYLHHIAAGRDGAAGAEPGVEAAASEDEAGMSFTFESIIDRLPDTASVTMSPTNDVLSATPLAHALFYAHLPETGPTPNNYRLLFTDPVTRAMFRYWEEEASLAVASLRFHAASHAADPAVSALVGELSTRSEDFARLWAAHPVRRCTRGFKVLDHPRYGALDLEYQILHSPDADGRRILIQTAAPGSETAEILQRVRESL